MVRSYVSVVGLVALVTMSALSAPASAQPTTPVDRFTFVAAQGSAAGPSGTGRLELVVSRWSTDEERDRVRAAAADDPTTLLHALRDSHSVGWMHWPGNLDYTVRYARRAPHPDGGERITLVIDSPVWVWWDASLAPGTPPTPFTVLELRIDKNGTGDGRLGFGTASVPEATAGIVFGPGSHPVLLTDLRRARSTT